MTAHEPASVRIDVLDVVIPVRDEEAHLGACIESVLRSAAHLRQSCAPATPLPLVRLVVVLDSCTDRSPAIARGFGAPVEVITVAEASVGGARLRGVAHLLEGVGTAAGRHHWVCSTDADSTVPESWLGSHLAVAHTGAVLALGRVQPEQSELPEPEFHAWRTSYLSEERPVHGANLGVRADVYRAAGGFAPLAEHEDVALVRAVHALGRPVAILPDSVVTTSGRLLGRTPGGFAGYLRSLRPEDA
ncbi:glycosyltransferase [Herbiconiux sp. 11R-BC]|uniref:glycosyltransferase n=1 Tax=Herbiconiux sp. 11R-BC TaxID=3111637 RepID=UPI003C0F9B27